MTPHGQTKSLLGVKRSKTVVITTKGNDTNDKTSKPSRSNSYK